MKADTPTLVEEDKYSPGGSGRMNYQDVFRCIRCMLEVEDEYLCFDYIDTINNAESDAIDETCRTKMTEWIFLVVDSTSLQRETASVAMHLLDRFLCSRSSRASDVMKSRKEYQLCAMTSFYLATKLLEPYLMDALTMSRLSRGLYSADEFISMERHILDGLKWKLNAPSTYQIVNHILELLPRSTAKLNDRMDEIYGLSHFMTELAVGDYALVSLRRSTIAIASILNSLGGIATSDFTNEDRICFISRIVHNLKIDIDSPKFLAVRERLLDSFAQSSGYELKQSLPCGYDKEELCAKELIEDSPTCVAKMSLI